MKIVALFLVFSMLGNLLKAQAEVKFVKFRNGEFTGLSDADGNIVVRPRFRSIYLFSRGLDREQFRIVNGSNDSIGVLRIAGDSLVIPLQPDIIPSKTAYGFSLFIPGRDGYVTSFHREDGTLINRVENELSAELFDRERRIYFVQPASQLGKDYRGDIVRITTYGYETLHEGVLAKRTWPADGGEPAITAPDGRTELYLDERLRLRTRPFPPDKKEETPPTLRDVNDPVAPPPPPPPPAYRPNEIDKNPNPNWVFSVTSNAAGQYGVDLDGQVYLPIVYDTVYQPALQFPEQSYFFLVRRGGRYNLVSKNRTWSKAWLEEIALPPARLGYAKNGNLYLHDRDVAVTKTENGYRVVSLFGTFKPDVYGSTYYFLSSSTVVILNETGYVVVNAHSKEILRTSLRPVKEGWSQKWKVLLEDEEGNTVGWMAMDGTKYFKDKK